MNAQRSFPDTIRAECVNSCVGNVTQTHLIRSDAVIPLGYWRPMLAGPVVSRRIALILKWVVVHLDPRE